MVKHPAPSSPDAGPRGGGRNQIERLPKALLAFETLETRTVLTGDSPWHNLMLAGDVNTDMTVSTHDAFAVIDYLRVMNVTSVTIAPAAPAPNGKLLDVTNNWVVNAADVDAIITALGGDPGGQIANYWTNGGSPPPGGDNSPPTITSNASASIAENTSSAVALTATDPNGDTVMFSIQGGEDAGRFMISMMNTLSFISPPNFEAPTDANGNNVYKVEVRATDTYGSWSSKAFEVAVANVNEAPTNISLSSSAVNENLPAGIVVGTLSATDPDVGDTSSFTLAAGLGDVDNAAFQIVGNQLKTNAAFDYETKFNYSIRVRAMDSGGLTYEKAFTISVNNRNDAPIITSPGTVSVPENTTLVFVLAATDADGDVLDFSISGGDDAAKFTFDDLNNELRFTIAPDFEAAADDDEDNVYEVEVMANDFSENPTTKTIFVTVTDVNEAPRIKDNPGGANPIIYSFSIGPDRTVTPPNNWIKDIIATDEDEGDQGNLAFSIEGGNADDLFHIDPASGVITLVEELSEAQATEYPLLVKVIDPGGLSDQGTVRIKIKNISVGITGDTQAVEGTSDKIRLIFVRQSTTGISGPLTVEFTVEWTDSSGGNVLSNDDFSDGPGKTALLAHSIVIDADQSQAILELVAPQDSNAEGLEGGVVKIIATADYAPVRSTVDAIKPNLAQKAFGLSSSAKLEVLDKIKIFADGKPGSPDGSLVHMTDIDQGYFGDCYFLAVLINLAQHHPGFIQNAIAENTDTEEPHDFKVKFYDSQQQPYTVDVTLDLARGLNGAQLSGDYDAGGVEVWPQILEQAYAQEHGGYAEMASGNSDDVWKCLTGKNW